VAYLSPAWIHYTNKFSKTEGGCKDMIGEKIKEYLRSVGVTQSCVSDRTKIS